MMTPALMELYAFLDTRHVDDNAKITDAFAKANPTLTITLEASAGPDRDRRHAQSGEPELHALVQPEHRQADRLSRSDVQRRSDRRCRPTRTRCTRCSTARCSTIGRRRKARLPDAGRPTAYQMTRDRLHDLEAGDDPSAGGGRGDHARSTICRRCARRPSSCVGTPRPGFFTTPAFVANWPTNTSNQMRVTLNQTLIVATGMADRRQRHDRCRRRRPGSIRRTRRRAAPCFGCHQLLDPTRSILPSTYS